jgi:hypothetical protein
MEGLLPGNFIVVLFPVVITMTGSTYKSSGASLKQLHTRALVRQLLRKDILSLAWQLKNSPIK